MSTSSPISRYHEVYVHQAPESEIEILNEDFPCIRITPDLPSPPRLPPYSQALLENDESAATQLIVEAAGSSSSSSSSSSNPSTSINEIVSTVIPEDRTGGGPPTYDEAVDPASAPPPSYDSLFGRVREARKSSKGLMDFAKNVLILLLGTLGCSIIVCVTIVIPVCMMVFGTLYMYDCPQGEYIPVYLLVGGGFGVLKQLMHLSTRVRSREEQEAERLRQSPTQQLINCFMFGWFIIGSFWIFKEYEPNYDPTKGKYCNKSLYMFAFWLIMSVYISLGLLTVGLCAVAVGSILTHRSRNANQARAAL